MEVARTRTVLDDLPYNLLEFFCSHVYTEKQALVPVQPIWGSKCCYVSRVWVQLNLMKGHERLWHLKLLEASPQRWEQDVSHALWQD